MNIMKQKTVVILLVVVVIIMGLFSFLKNKSSDSEFVLSDSTKSTTVDKSMALSGDPVPNYIFKHQTMNMSQAKIDRIYDAESYYFQFIGNIDQNAF